MFNYTSFITSLRNEDLKEITIELVDDFVPNLKNFLIALNSILWEDGAFHLFYEQVKNIVTKFITFWECTIDEVIKLKDCYCNEIDKDVLLELISNSLIITENKQNDFIAESIGVEEVNTRYKKYVNGLKEMRDTVLKFDRPHYAKSFANDHLGKTITKTYALMNLTHTAIGFNLFQLMYKIKMSIEENISRIKTNVRYLKQEDEATRKQLNHEFCDKYNELVTLRRQTVHNFEETAELNQVKTDEPIWMTFRSQVNKKLNKITKKWENNNNSLVTVSILESELNYWKNRFNDLNTIDCNLTILKQKIDNAEKEMFVYKKSKCHNLWGPKKSCWENIGNSYAEHLKYLKQTLNQTVKTLVTHFCVRGPDTAQYTDQTQIYCLDNFGQQVIIDNNSKKYHRDENNKEKTNEKYNIDKYGRYFTNQNGERIYKASDCRSSYKLGNDNTFVKIHEAESFNTDKICCPIGREEEKGQILEKETAEYLWSSAGILSKTLCDVLSARPKDPMHFFAHRLLANKYKMSNAELKKLQLDSDEHRTNKIQLRKNKRAADMEAWKTKQVKRRLPEESDDLDGQREVFHYYSTFQYDYNNE